MTQSVQAATLVQFPAGGNQRPSPEGGYSSAGEEGRPSWMRRTGVSPKTASLALAGADWIVVLGLAIALAPSVPNWLDAPVALAAKAAAVCLALKVGVWLASGYRTARTGAGGFALTVSVIACAILGWWPLGALQAAGAGNAASVLFAVAAPITIFMHLAVRWGVRAAVRAGDWAETAVVVGATEAARRFIAQHKDGRKVRVVAVFDDRLSRAPSAVENVPVLGDIDALLTWEHLPYVDHIVLSVTPSAEARVRELIARLRLAPNQISLLLDFEGWSPESGVVQTLGRGASAMTMSGHSKPDSYFVAKRVQDVALSAAMLVAFAPLMAVIALAIRLDGPGPILFRQNRHGLNNRIITVLKFRTMRPMQAHPGGVEQVQADDPRVTRVGRFLRTTSLDELPQLFNVLVGEMSLVGPRPHAIGMRTGSIETCRIVADYAHRHRLKPGITGWAQINGSRGPVHTETEVRERVRLDLEYIERTSFWFDLWILLRTAPALLGDKMRVR